MRSFPYVVKEWRQQRKQRRWKHNELCEQVHQLSFQFDEIVGRFNERTELQNQIDFLNKRIAALEKQGKDSDEVADWWNERFPRGESDA